MTFRIEKSPIILSFVTNQSYQRQQYTHQTKNNQMHLWKSCELKDMHCYSNMAELLLTSQRSERSKTVVMIDTIVSVCLPVCLVWSLWQKTPVCQSVRLLFLTSKNSLNSLAITAHGPHLYIETVFADPLYNATKTIILILFYFSCYSHWDIWTVYSFGVLLIGYNVW